MPALGGNWNPAQVMMKPQRGMGGGQPYVGSSAPTPGFGAAQAIRASGNNPGFNAAYLQNLATYALGQFAPQGPGTQSINPLNPGQQFGTPTGGGNAPVMGMPTTQLAQAMGGQPAAQPAQSSGGGGGESAQVLSMPDWIDQMLQQGSQFGLNGVGGFNGNTQ